MKYIITFLLCLFSTQAVSQTTWKTFNHKNGFTIQLPDYFKTGLLVAGETLQYYTTEKDNQIYLNVETAGEGTQETLQSSFNADLKSDEIAYKLLKPTWYVVSGKQEGDIFYNKTIIKDGVLYCLNYSYSE
jgi:hypothetical protein